MLTTNVIGLDFWDTVAFRRVHPETIIALWAKSIKSANGLTLDSSVLYITRKQAEVSLCKETGREPRYSEIITRVYSQLKESLNNIREQDFLKQSFRFELELEKRNIFLNDTLIGIVSKQAPQSKIVIISDFYLGEDFIKELCIHLKIDDMLSGYYISSDIGARKSDGKLYRHVLKDLNIAPEELTMIGDNRSSDQAIPQAMGINILSQEACSNKTFYRKKNMMISLLRNASGDNHVLNGYSTVFFLFTARLYDIAKKDKAKCLFFCSREGQFLKKIFDSYQQITQSIQPIRTEYLYVSRRATFLASLAPCPEETFQRLFLNFSSCSIVDFLDNLSFHGDEINSLLETTKTDKDTLAFPRGTDSRFDAFLSSDSFVQQYEAKRIAAKTNLRHYLKQHDCDKALFMVDIGWRGSIQDNIFHAMDRKITVCGYYFGLKNAISTENNRKHGLIFDNVQKPKSYDLLSFNYPDLEIISSADHGPVEEYALNNAGVVIPVIKQDPKELLVFDYIKTNQESLFQQIKTIINAFNNSIYDWERFSNYLLTRYIHQLCCYRSKHFDYYYDYRKLVRENFGLKRPTGGKQFVLRGYFVQLRWGFVNYVYRLTSRLRLSFLDPLCFLYCNIIYLFKTLLFHLNRHGC